MPSAGLFYQCGHNTSDITFISHHYTIILCHIFIQNMSVIATADKIYIIKLRYTFVRLLINDEKQINISHATSNPKTTK